jgi:O-antigen ligase
MPVAALAFVVFARVMHLRCEVFLLGVFCGLLGNIAVVELFKAGIPVPTYQVSGGRFAGLFSHPNQYGIIIAMYAPLWAWAINRSGLVVKYLGVMGIIISCFGLVQCISKTNIVLFIIGVIISIPLLGQWNLDKLIYASGKVCFVVGLIALGAIAAFDFLTDTYPREAMHIEQALFDPTAVGSFVERLALWDEAIALVAKHPLLGVGPEESKHALSFPHAHNYLLQLHLQAGLLGLLGILAITAVVFTAFFAALKNRQKDRGGIADCSEWTLAAALSSVIYLCSNLMSDSFNTATMSAFSVSLAFAVSGISRSAKSSHVEMWRHQASG